MELKKPGPPEWIDVEYEGETLQFLVTELRGSVLWNVMTSLGPNGQPGGAELIEALKSCVKDWRGITEGGAPVSFSPKALEQLFEHPDAAPLLALLGTRVVAHRSRGVAA